MLLRPKLPLVSLLLLALVSLTIAATAQTTVGLQPFGSYTSGLDQINLADLGIHIDIPL